MSQGRLGRLGQVGQLGQRPWRAAGAALGVAGLVISAVVVGGLVTVPATAAAGARAAAPAAAAPPAAASAAQPATHAWSAAAVAATPHGSVTATSCTSAAFCMAVDSGGNAIRATGTTWAAPVKISPWGLVAVSCASPSSCLAIDGRLGYATFDGTRWSARKPFWGKGTTVPSYTYLNSVSCPVAGFCLAVGTHGESAVYRSGRWSAPTLVDNAGGSMQVSCASATFCLAVDQRAQWLTFDGRAWSTARKTTLTSGSEYRVSCVSRTFCAAVGPYAAVFNGTSWSAPAFLAGTGNPPVLSCGSATSCQTRSGDAAYQFDGARWNKVTGPPGGATTLSCPTAAAGRFCLATATADTAIVYATRYDGTGWGGRVAIDWVDDATLNTVSCPTSTFCMAADWRAFSVPFDGKRWGRPLPMPQQAGLWFSTLSCSGPRFCLAVGAHYAAVFDGTRWTDRSNTQLDSLISVSCPTSTFCMAVDNSRGAYRFTGTAWSPRVTIETGGNGLVSVSCADPGFCVALDSGGRAITWNGSSWSPPRVLVQTPFLNSVSCPSRTFCMATDTRGGTLTFDGRSWSARRQASPNATFSRVVCTAARFCVALATPIRLSPTTVTVYSGPPLMEYRSGRWAAPTLTDKGTAPAAVSCTPTGTLLCVGVGPVSVISPVARAWTRR